MVGAFQRFLMIGVRDADEKSCPLLHVLSVEVYDAMLSGHIVDMPSCGYHAGPFPEVGYYA